MKFFNPFIINSYIKPRYFCDRKSETSFLLKKIDEGKNLLLYSKNGIGKTTLVKHLFHIIDDHYIPLYIDLQNIINANSLYVKVYKILKAELKKADQEAKEEESFDINIANGNEILSQLKILVNKNLSEDRKIIIAFDNIPSIKWLEEIQFEELVLVLSDNPHTSSLIIKESNSFTYSSFESFELGKIPEKRYRKFISKLFETNKVSISTKSLDLLFKMTRGESYATHLICSKLWLTGSKKIKSKLVKLVYDDILLESQKGFTLTLNLLSFYQIKLLLAIASEGGARQITSQQFIKKYELNAASSVKTAVKSLLDREIILKKDNYYQVQSILFEWWLKSFAAKS
jgi:energy-coupling factor transporter ATP-binding protein EcfA2